MEVDTEAVVQAFNAASSAGWRATGTMLLRALIVLVVCIIAERLIMKLIARILSKSHLDKNVHTFVRSVINALLWFLILVIVADQLGINATSLIAVLSVAGLAISLAVQGSLSNLAGGLTLLITKPFVTGDYISAGGVEGNVLDVGLVYTRLVTLDNKQIAIPNQEISTAKIINYSREPRRRVDLTFSASYDAPVEKVKEAISKVLKEHPMTLATPEPFVRVSGYGEHAIDYVARVWCGNADYWTVYFDVMEGVKAAFDAEGISMTYPHLNVHMVADQ